MNKNIERIIVLILFLSFMAQGMANIRHTSLTFDEGPHLAVGYTTLQTKDYRLQPIHIHPPLANIIAAAPLLLQNDLPNPTEIDGWEGKSLSAVTDKIVWKYPYPARIASAGRVPMLLLGCLLAAILFRWAQIIGGRISGLVALTLYVFDPNIIAHSSLITTDITVTLLSTTTLFLATLYLFPVSSVKRRPLFLVLSGILLGLAQLSKVSALLLFPVLGGFTFIIYLIQERNFLTAFTHTFIFLLVIICIAAFTLWAGYGFEVSRPADLSFPIPAGTHWAIYNSLTEHYQLGHPAFAFGQISSHGWWWYFPLAFLIKTPIPTLILVLLTLFSGASQLINKNTDWFHIISHNQSTIIVIWVTLYAFSSLFSSVNIGYRHLLPILPGLYILIGRVVSKMWDNRLLIFHSLNQQSIRIVSGFVIVLLIWQAVGTVRSAPSSLEYFNAFVGGQHNGYQYLVDSNLDWGQNLWDLRDWTEKTKTQSVRYAHYSPASPEQYGITADFLPPDPRAVHFTPWHPEPGIYVIGATVLQGVYTPDINTFAYFRKLQPLSRLGNAIFIYKIEERMKPAWAVSCHPEPGMDAVKKALSHSNLRTVYIDCQSVQVYPTNSGPGIYIVPPEIQVPISGNPQVELKQANGKIWRVIYSIDTAPKPRTKVNSTYFESSPLHFMGYTLDLDTIYPGDKVELYTYWLVKEIVNRPLSLLAHLTTPGQPPLSVGDGMGFPIEKWTKGDIIIQKHLLGLPPTVDSEQKVTLVTGGYWLDTMERWATHHEDNVIVLKEFTVR